MFELNEKNQANAQIDLHTLIGVQLKEKLAMHGTPNVTFRTTVFLLCFGQVKCPAGVKVGHYYKIFQKAKCLSKTGSRFFTSKTVQNS